jgi:hypothetical protein
MTRFSAKVVLPIVQELLAQHHPMTLRQIHYQLVSCQAVENTSQSYDSLSKALISARQEGTIPWEWMEDRLRRPRAVAMWDSIAEFGEDEVDYYRRNVWPTQPRYLEVWVEKDALSGIFEDVLEPYGVTLNVGRGYDGWSSIKNAADRLLLTFSSLMVARNADPIIHYYGDFDPSGEQMVVSLEQRLRWFGVDFEIEKVALTKADIRRYRLPPNFTKRTDTRAAAHIAKHGDISVELDALPVDVLRRRIVTSVESVMDLAALKKVRKREHTERGQIKRLFANHRG